MKVLWLLFSTDDGCTDDKYMFVIREIIKNRPIGRGLVLHLVLSVATRNNV